MDAYAFATSATPDAIAALRDLVDDGTLRVMLPLAGAHAAYAAASADTPEDLFDRLDTVRTIAGLGGVVVYPAADGGDSTTPTWLVVMEVVGFCLLRTAPGAAGAVHTLASALDDVIGLAIVNAEDPTVLCEVTGPTAGSLTGAFDQLGTLAGVVGSATSVGYAELGRGLRRE